MSTDTLTVFKKAVPKGNNLILAGVNAALAKEAQNFGLDTPKKIAAFLAQAAHESAGFSTLKEFGNDAYFKKYDGRVDLGNVKAGDGLKFKGRGIFQITGRANYASISKQIFGDLRLLETPGILEQPYYATLSALIFWKNKGLGALAESGNFLALSTRINGVAKKVNGVGYPNGWEDRQAYLKKFNDAISIFNPALFLANYVKKKSSNAGGFFSGLYNNWVANATARVK